jgi:hypothetical protein
MYYLFIMLCLFSLSTSQIDAKLSNANFQKAIEEDILNKLDQGCSSSIQPLARGPTGPAGPKGARGAKGARGPRGANFASAYASSSTNRPQTLTAANFIRLPKNNVSPVGITHPKANLFIVQSSGTYTISSVVTASNARLKSQLLVGLLVNGANFLPITLASVDLDSYEAIPAEIIYSLSAGDIVQLFVDVKSFTDEPTSVDVEAVFNMTKIAR